MLYIFFFQLKTHKLKKIMRRALCSAETKEQAVSGIVPGTLAALGGKTLSWSNNAAAEHLQGLCVTALVQGTFDFCIGEGPSVPLLPSLPPRPRGEVGPGLERWPLAAAPRVGVDGAGIGNEPFKEAVSPSV